MKAKIFLALALGLITVACTQDFDETTPTSALQPIGSEKIVSHPEGATLGALAIKISATEIDVIEQGTTRRGKTRSGIQSIDNTLDQIGASSFKRIFNDPLFEENLRRAGLHRWYKVCFDDEVALHQAALNLAANKEIEAVQYMHRPRHITEGVTKPFQEDFSTRAERTEEYPMNDPDLNRQWHYHNTGALERSIEGADINLFKAWEYCTGDESIIVAVIDQPVQYSHEDLQNNMWVNTFDADPKLKHGANFCTQSETPIEIDWDYMEGGYPPHHGTHVAGTVAAVNGNNKGGCGVAGGSNGKGGVKIMGCQIFHEPDKITAESAANAFVWAANRGAHIAQCSWGYSPSATMQYWTTKSDYEVEAIKYFINNERTNSPINGGIVIFAAGNDGNNLINGTQIKDKMMVPAAYSQVVSVAATAPDFYPAYYTNYGSWVDLSAPGGDSDLFGTTGMVYSTVINGYGYSEGTSMACPHVSGVAALGLSYAKKLGKQFTTEVFKSMLQTSTNKVDANYEGTHVSTGYLYNDYGLFTGESQEVILDWSNYREKMGAGQIDAFRMMMAVEGTPVMIVAPNQEVTLPVREIMGGMAQSENFRIELLPENEEEAEAMGITCNVEGLTARVKAAQPGITRVMIQGKMMSGNSSVSGSTVSMPVAIICRDYQAANGGWL